MDSLGPHTDWGTDDWRDYSLWSTITPDASFVFNFTGTSVAGLGGNRVARSHIPAIASYSLDGGAHVNFTVCNLATLVLDTSTAQTIFQTYQVAPGNHSIRIVYHGDSTTTPLALYSLLVTGTENVLSVDPPPPAQSPPAQTTSTSLPTSSILVHSKSHRDAYTAAVAICIILVATSFLVGSLHYRRRKRRFESKPFCSDSIDPAPTGVHVSPFINYPSIPYSKAAKEKTGKDRLNSRGQSQAQVGRVEIQQTFLPASSMPPRISAQIHVDSGVTMHLPTEEDVVVDFPPAYTSLCGDSWSMDL
ncbi:hypothetical protein JR316_0005456 [Psilocybe cubensis]|uniref:Transmembrane protein n=2 Tax=Psilocybe cubensis TaxID=181762 RepID=A0A8H8CDU1_PSICU|nr:hypothetical protein JR316_0005456 [Psilocybe cubensis]KAH9483350.1 hypothetical protein JR316_0005456 [Psilocybe cubensis]